MSQTIIRVSSDKKIFRNDARMEKYEQERVSSSTSGYESPNFYTRYNFYDGKLLIIQRPDNFLKIFR